MPLYVLFLANVPAYFASLHLLHAPNVQTFTGQLTHADVHTLQAWGLSLDFYAACMVGVSLLFQFSYASVGVLLFYRCKYDATRTLAAFSATLQNEVDLSQLSEQLLAVVEETLQPTHVSLWLLTPEKTATVFSTPAAPAPPPPCQPPQTCAPPKIAATKSGAI